MHASHDHVFTLILNRQQLWGAGQFPENINEQVKRAKTRKIENEKILPAVRNSYSVKICPTSALLKIITVQQIVTNHAG